MVLYRKYRPQSLDELVGQEVVKRSILAAFLGKRLSHAYLFCGPRGTGKTSTARILAKMVSCTKVDTKSGSPCNLCDICASITNGSNLDLVEIDAASNRGIDDIRALRETIKLSPTSLGKKIYIIDEVHMLTTEAFNALLKILEEPPSHALFILATTEVQKVPQTILSRVTKLEFKLASPDEIRKNLKDVGQKEKISLDDEVLLELARLSGGSFRDGVKLLDQLSQFDRINLEIVRETFGQGQLEAATKLLNLVAGGDSPQAIGLFLQVVEGGADVKQFNLLILDILRQLLLIKNDLADELVKPYFIASQFSSLVDLAKQISVDELVKMIDNFSKSLEQLKSVSLVTLPMEVAIIQSTQLSVLSGQLSDNSQPVISSSETDKQKTDKENSENRKQKTDKEDVQTLHDKWNYILETIRPHNYSLEALLRSVKIREVSNSVVLIEVPYSFHQRILQAPKSSDLLESVLSDVLGRTVKVSTILGQRPLRSDDISNIEVAQDDEIVRIAAEIFSSETVN